MSDLRKLTAAYVDELDRVLENGPDKTYILRRLREIAMWINVCLTRTADGSPRP